MANTKRAPAGAKKAAPSGARKPAKAKQASETRYDLLSLTYIGLAILVLIIAIISPDEYSPLYAVKRFHVGMFGYLIWLVPALFIWLSTISVRYSNERGRTLRYSLLATLIFICVLSATEAFCVSAIENGSTAGNGMRLRTSYINFLAFAYRARTGGGLVGALLAWPVYKLATEWGALILFLLITLLALTGLRKISINRIGRRMGEKISDMRKKRAQRPPKAPREKTARAAHAAKARAETPRSDGEDLHIEEIVNPIDVDLSDVKPPKLNRKGTNRKTTTVKSPGDELVIPDVAPAKSSKRGANGASDEQIDLMSAVREQDEQVRNSAYIKNALGKHDIKHKPVLTYDIGGHAQPDQEIDDDMFDPNFTYQSSGTKDAPANTQSDHAPAQPKPSFFDDAPAPKRQKPKADKSGEDEKSFEAEIIANVPEQEYAYPPIDLINAGTALSEEGYRAADLARAQIIIKKLQDFSIQMKLSGIAHGPAVTRFEFTPAPGIKVSRITSLSDDIAMSLAATAIRIEAPIPGKNAIGVEVPNEKVELVHLRDVLESKDALDKGSRLAVGLGKDNAGNYIVVDLAKMPHLLIAGQTGSGKSVCINSIIISLLYRATPDEVRLILIDPKMVELNVYNKIPHLLVPVVTEAKKAASALDWAVGEMTNRYRAFAERGAKEITSYNRRLEPDEKPMPQIVVIIDELADLMVTSPREVEESINRLAQLARAAGIHLVIATQRPSVDVITGLIKANIPSRIAFSVASGVDSRTIIDRVGAERLLGNGDMLFLPQDRNKPMRVQGTWVSEQEIQDVVDYITGYQTADYNEEVIEHMDNALLSDAEKDDKRKDNGLDPLFVVALKCVIDAQQASISMLQRKLRVGFARAGRLIDDMATLGYVSQSLGSKSREVLITREQFHAKYGDDIPEMPQ